MGQGISTTQFFLYGRQEFRQTGYVKHAKHYKDPVQTAPYIGLNQKGTSDGISMENQVVVITGANSGIGKEQATYAAVKGAKVYIVCRSEDKANAARDEILKQIQSDPLVKNENVEILLCDVGELKQVRETVETLQNKESKVDVLVCNAGVLLNDYKETSEGNELTFASHLLGGSYLLSTLLLPQLRASIPKESASTSSTTANGPRVIFTSSGGMYGNPWPGWDAGTSSGKYKHKDKYEGNFAYSCAKRGQVLLAEEYTKIYPEIKWVSTHPGWVRTSAVDSAYGDKAKYLEPMRTPWEGAEGICWLMSTPSTNIQSGEFYLDRQPQRKHISGPFFTDGTYTKNTQSEIDDFMKNLKEAAGV